MKSTLKQARLTILLALTVALFSQPAQPIEPTTAFLLGVATTVSAYHYRAYHSADKVYHRPAVVQRKVEVTFPSYQLTHTNMRSSRTKYLKVPKMRGHICGHDGFCLGH